ncbi:SufE family protein [bacterium]|nr:SufE family protein [bacterium]
MQLDKEDLDFLNELEPSDLYELIVEKGVDTVPTKELLDELCIDDNRVYGCQSLVWVNRIDDKWYWESNAFFVQGLINVVMTHVVHMTDEEIDKIKVDDFAFICPEKVTWGRVRGIESFLRKLKIIVNGETE